MGKDQVQPLTFYASIHQKDEEKKAEMKIECTLEPDHMQIQNQENVLDQDDFIDGLCAQ